MSGERSFTCRNPCSSDPVSQIWFDVRLDGRTYRAHEMERGFPLTHVELVCDLGKPGGHVLSWPKELEEYAPLMLSCNIKRWDN